MWCRHSGASRGGVRSEACSTLLNLDVIDWTNSTGEPATDPTTAASIAGDLGNGAARGVAVPS